MQFRRWVRGYHGTSIANAEAIVHDDFQLSHNRGDWLGDGVYFWEEAPIRARDWARQHHGADAAVIEALIDLDLGCMDLGDSSWHDFLTDVYVGFAKRRQSAGRPLPKQDPNSGPHYLDRVIINRAVLSLKTLGVDICVVRATFREGPPLYPGSAFHRQDHVQLAVRDTAAIMHKSIISR